MKTLKSFLKSDSAVSFGFLVIAVFLILGTAIWIEFAPVFNTFFTYYNEQISSGTISLQNQKSMEFHQNILVIVPLIMLLGVGCWGIIRSLEKKNEV